MSKRVVRCGVVVIAGICAALAVACGGGGSSATPTSAPAVTPTSGASTAPASSPAAGSPTAAASGTPASATNPCTTRTAIDGSALAAGLSYTALDPVRWQFCNGGAAAGSSEKYLFRSQDAGTTWTLISQTTLGNPTPQAGVGELPNGNGASALFFQDTSKGWLGLTSPGDNFYSSADGGVTWTPVSGAVPPAVPVTAITFSSASNGTVTTADGTWTTTDGGTTWTKSP